MNAAPLETRAIDRCLACGQQSLEPLAMRYEHRGAFPAARCPRCDMRFLTVQPTPAALAGMYASAYFEKDFRCGRSDSDYFSEDAFRGENAGLLDAFERLGPRGDLLEVGCAGGWLLKHAIERGWKAQGVELSADAVARARGLGLEVFHGELADAGLLDQAFDLVYMGDVLEHVPDCRAVLAEVVRVLKPGGHLYLRGPITTNSLARRLALAGYAMLGRTIVLREPPYHLWEFTPRSLRNLAAAVGLEIVELSESKIPPGRAHGRKTAAQRLVMGLLDAVNAPVTRVFNAFGDRVVLVARRRGRG
jgi:SAM-dependent methyltransferase